jgi:hypothetical protein
MIQHAWPTGCTAATVPVRSSWFAGNSGTPLNTTLHSSCHQADVRNPVAPPIERKSGSSQQFRTFKGIKEAPILALKRRKVMARDNHCQLLTSDRWRFRKSVALPDPWAGACQRPTTLMGVRRRRRLAV